MPLKKLLNKLSKMLFRMSVKMSRLIPVKMVLKMLSMMP
jgi:hypothetical protein